MVNLISSNFAVMEDFQSAVLREGIPVEKGLLLLKIMRLNKKIFIENMVIFLLPILIYF